MDSATNDLRKLFDRLREDTQRFKLAEDHAHLVPAPKPRVIAAVTDAGKVAERGRQRLPGREAERDTDVHQKAG
jgi:hypothetical protein